MYKNLVRKCLLCHETICDNTYPHKLKPSHFLRSLYFDNYIGAGKYIDKVKCSKCKGLCQSKCINECDKVNIKTLINNYEFKHIDEKILISQLNF